LLITFALQKIASKLLCDFSQQNYELAAVCVSSGGFCSYFFFSFENVGNLVCPSSFDLGENIKMVIASVPEGHDKPFKYTSMFEAADIIILNKVDLMPYIDFDRDAFYKGIRAVNSKAQVFEVSCRTGEGLDKLIQWIDKL
jgi:hydrogenase accessory protein HypB